MFNSLVSFDSLVLHHVHFAAGAAGEYGVDGATNEVHIIR